MWVDQAAKRLDAQVRWMPFELHPGTPEAGADKPFTDAQWPAIRERLLGLARRVGLPMDPPRRNVNSRLALETGELVRELAGDPAMATFHHAVSQAFFAEGANVADIAVVARHAEAAGVDASAVANAWSTRRYRAAVDASGLAAAQAGVAGVPAFGWPGMPATSGMMEPDAIVAVLQRQR